MIWFNFTCVQLSRKLFTLILAKEFITKFQFDNKKNDFHFKKNDFLQFYLQKYFDSSSFKKVIYTNYEEKNIILFANEFLIKKKNKDLNPLFLKNNFNPILIKEKKFFKKIFLDNFIKN